MRGEKKYSEKVMAVSLEAFRVLAISYGKTDLLPRGWNALSNDETRGGQRKAQLRSSLLPMLKIVFKQDYTLIICYPTHRARERERERLRTGNFSEL